LTKITALIEHKSRSAANAVSSLGFKGGKVGNTPIFPPFEYFVIHQKDNNALRQPN